MPTKFTVRAADNGLPDIEVTTKVPEIFGAFVQATIAAHKIDTNAADGVPSRKQIRHAFFNACQNACAAGLGEWSRLAGSAMRGVN